MEFDSFDSFEEMWTELSNLQNEISDPSKYLNSDNDLHYIPMKV